MPGRVVITDAVDPRVTLNVLSAVKRGDFSARMPANWTGTAGRVAAALNEIIESNQRLERELQRLSKRVGKEGQMKRAPLGDAGGAWASTLDAVNDLIEKAIELRASDIHIEPFRTGLTVRMRVDGLLQVVPTPPDVLPQAVISRVKILAGLNIAERRLPQDGAAHLHIARSEMDVRVATMPTPHGESAVIRLLPKNRGVLEIRAHGVLLL